MYMCTFGLKRLSAGVLVLQTLCCGDSKLLTASGASPDLLYVSAGGQSS